MKSIIFSAPMIRQLLAGKKTMTRRPVKTTDRGPRFDVGDTVYVKEGWGRGGQGSYPGPNCIFYREDYEKVKDSGITWMSPLFMPEEYTRMYLHITGVKKEAVGMISDVDAIQEGFDTIDEFFKTWSEIYPSSQIIDQVWVYEFTVELVKHP